jgi:hypothetical protein
MDVVVGQRVGRDGPSSLWQAVARMPARPKLVFEMDDDVWSLAHEEKSNPASPMWRPLLENVERNLACSDAVTVSTAPLADVVSRFTKAPIHVVPNAMPSWVLEAGQGMPPRTHPHTLGWSGSRTHDDDWREDRAYQVVTHWADSANWNLDMLGEELPAPFREAWRLDPKFGRTIREHPWIKGWPKYFQHLRSLDVGLAPLARTRFNRSKSDLRVLELAACGIPWVATDYGPYSVAGENAGGVRVSGSREWRWALTDFVKLPYLRTQLRSAGLAWAVTRTIDKVLPRWETALGL